MKPLVKVAIVAGGYLLAFLAAAAAVALNEARLRVSAPQASDGMAAFGDLVLFVIVFGALALVPTGAALFFILSRNKRPVSGPTATALPPGAELPPRPR